MKLSIIKEQLPANSYLYYCFEAMKDLYGSLNWIYINKDEMDGDDVQVYERNFIISLVYKLSKQGLTLPGLINGEVAKSLDAASLEAKKEYLKIKRMRKSDYNPNSYYVFPDFLIHESHSSEEDTWTQQKQHIIIEAKTTYINSAYLFFLDFFKLNFYLGELNYENAVYIIVGTPISIINKYLSMYESQINYLKDNRLDSLFFFIQEQIDNEPQIYKLTKG